MRIALAFLATEADGDFISSSIPIFFSFGSVDGDVVCANVTVLPDGMIECEEDFVVNLALNTVGENIALGNNFTVVTLADSEGNINFVYVF